MAGIKDRVYLADSKTIVRRKLGLDKEQNDEEFAKLENICSRLYRFKLAFDPRTKWSHLDRSIVEVAKSMIADECRKEKLKLGDSASILSELIEWKIYQLHRTAQKKADRQGKHADAGPSNRSSQLSILDSISGPSKELLDQSESQFQGQHEQ